MIDWKNIDAQFALDSNDNNNVYCRSKSTGFTRGEEKSEKDANNIFSLLGFPRAAHYKQQRTIVEIRRGIVISLKKSNSQRARQWRRRNGKGGGGGRKKPVRRATDRGWDARASLPGPTPEESNAQHSDPLQLPNNSNVGPH